MQDHIQRLNIEQQSLEQNLQSFDHVQPKQPFLQHSISQSAVVPGDIQGIVTVQYGLEGTTLRKIFVKVRITSRFGGKKWLKLFLMQNRFTLDRNTALDKMAAVVVGLRALIDNHCPLTLWLGALLGPHIWKAKFSC